MLRILFKNWLKSHPKALTKFQTHAQSRLESDLRAHSQAKNCEIFVHHTLSEWCLKPFSVWWKNLIWSQSFRTRAIHGECAKTAMSKFFKYCRNFELEGSEVFSVPDVIHRRNAFLIIPEGQKATASERWPTGFLLSGFNYSAFTEWVTLCGWAHLPQRTIDKCMHCVASS